VPGGLTYFSADLVAYIAVIGPATARQALSSRAWDL
jgi:hypothetical protein